jgi:hypothetical protein
MHVKKEGRKEMTEYEDADTDMDSRPGKLSGVPRIQL